jgi:hypothetical protein
VCYSSACTASKLRGGLDYLLFNYNHSGPNDDQYHHQHDNFDDHFYDDHNIYQHEHYHKLDDDDSHTLRLFLR